VEEDMESEMSKSIVNWKSGILAIVAIALLLAAAEAGTSIATSHLGPFRHFADAPGTGNVMQRAELAIASYFAAKPNSGDGIKFLVDAGFTCDKPWNDELMRKKEAQYNQQISSGIFCSYAYGRYFLYSEVWMVGVPFDADGKGMKPEIFMLK
jgi:hypothetical protein